MASSEHRLRHNDRYFELSRDLMVTAGFDGFFKIVRVHHVRRRGVRAGDPREAGVDRRQRARARARRGPRRTTCSAGLASFDGSESAEELVGRADAALYEAKLQGRNRTVIAREGHDVS